MDLQIKKWTCISRSNLKGPVKNFVPSVPHHFRWNLYHPMRFGEFEMLKTSVKHKLCSFSQDHFVFFLTNDFETTSWKSSKNGRRRKRRRRRRRLRRRADAAASRRRRRRRRQKRNSPWRRARCPCATSRSPSRRRRSAASAASCTCRPCRKRCRVAKTSSTLFTILSKVRHLMRRLPPSSSTFFHPFFS